MNDQFHQQIGKMMSSIEYNTKLTEKVASDVSEINVHLAKLSSKVAAHSEYLTNLDSRIVEERKARQEIREEIAFAKGVHKNAGAVAGGVWGVLSSILVGVGTYFLTK